MTLDTEDKKWIKGAVVDGVLEAINQVIIPYSDEQEKRYKAEFRRVDEKIEKLDDKLSNKLEVLERKLDNVTDQQAEKLNDYGRRLGKLELKRL